MASPGQLEILKRGVEAWNGWRKILQNIKPDLRGADLRGADLQGAILFETNLRGADLQGANLRNADLFAADLVQADLERSQLERAYLKDANLQGSDLQGADLQGANLQRAMLYDAILIGADLQGADFRGANLRNADLGGTKLLGANFQGADLRQAYLVGADLGGTNFQRADLRGANLGGTNLQGANLQGASLEAVRMNEAMVGATVFGGLDLRYVQGLDTVHHGAPSTLGIDTLYYSEGNIPRIFLRGCGVPESMIEYACSLIGEGAIDYYSCFISYSHADKSFAHRLYEALQGRGIRCWLDEYQMLPGHNIYDEVDRGIRLWDKILLCASQHSLTSWWVDNEINSAFEKERHLWKDRGSPVRALIPLNLDGYLLSSAWANGKAKQIRQRLAADFAGWEHDDAKFEREFEKLVRALRTDEGREEPPPSRL